MSNNVKVSKESLDLAVTAFKYNKTMLKRALDAESPNERAIVTKMKSLMESLDRLNNAHTVWMTKAALADDEMTNETNEEKIAKLGGRVLGTQWNP